jgi:imidazole glycerol-phosphate synthase subunit HisF
MLRPRIIPCLLIYKGALVKTRVFKDPKYVGDPINAVRIFNEKEADELIVLDIGATVHSMQPNFSLIAKLAAECRMPLCYGGGVTSAEQATKLVDMGVEKVAVSAAAISKPLLLREMVAAVGSQSVVVVLDLYKKKNSFSKSYELCSHNATKFYKDNLFALIKTFQELGVGEIVINSVDRDGLMQGYDLELVQQVKSKAKVPLTFLGGAGSPEHLSELISQAGTVGAAAGSLFVFKGSYRAVLINYPTPEQKMKICQQALIVNNDKGDFRV